MVPLYVVCGSHGFSSDVQCIGTWCMTCFITNFDDLSGHSYPSTF